MKRSSVGTPQADVRLDGEVFSVAAYTLGVTLASNVSAGATSMTVLDPWGLPPEGRLRIEVEEGGAGEEIGYTLIDEDTGIVTLETPLAYAWLAGDWFTLLPVATVGEEGEPQLQRLANSLVAMVRLAPDDDEPVIARIPANLAAALPQGFLDPPVPATIQRQGDEWVLVDLPTTPASVATDQLVTGGLIVVDPVTGETVASITPDGADFQRLSAEFFESEAVPIRNVLSTSVYVDPVNGLDTNAGDAVLPFLDEFNRTLATTWGTADQGGGWGQAQYQGSNTPDVGNLLPGAARLRANGGSQTNVMLSNDFALLDGECYAEVNYSALHTTGTVWSGVGRITDSANYYVAALGLTAAGAMTLLIQKEVGGTYTTIVSTGLPTYVGGTTMAIRFQVQVNPDGGTDLRAKGWKAGDPEPEAWMLETLVTETGPIASSSRWGCFQQTAGGFAGTSHYQVLKFNVNAIAPDGTVIDVTQEGVGPLQTIAAGIALAKQWNEGTIRINFIGDCNEDIDIRGVTGGGSITIDGGQVGVLVGRVIIQRVHHYIELRDFLVQQATDGVNSAVFVDASHNIEFTNVDVQGNGVTANCYNFTQGSMGRVTGSQLNGGTATCVQVLEQSTVYLADNTGAGGSTGAYRASAATIFVDGTKPTGTNVEANGGLIRGTTTTNTAGTAPPTSTKKTKVVTCNATKTWRPSWYWKSGDDPIQGSYGGNPNSRGMFYYGTKCQTAGRKCVSIKVTLKRQSTGGASSAQGVYVWCHNLKTQSDSGADSNTPYLNDGPYKVGELAWGQTKTFSLPKAWGDNLLSGSRKGIAIFVSDGSPYLWLAGRGGNTNQGKLTIVHEPI